MNKLFLSALLLSFLFLPMSCKKTLEPADEDKVSFLIRLPSIALAQFEVRCSTEDVFINQVIIQSPSSFRTTEEFDYTRFAKDEVFLVGNQAAEDGLWLINFIGRSAITNVNFNTLVPYEMVIIADDNE